MSNHSSFDFIDYSATWEHKIAMKASDRRAISAFLSCISETTFTSPTVEPDISTGIRAFGMTLHNS
ncbi:hypothetical protein ACHQM5_029698 [Ranunculus cassubicifolius]